MMPIALAWRLRRTPKLNGRDLERLGHATWRLRTHLPLPITLGWLAIAGLACRNRYWDTISVGDWRSWLAGYVVPPTLVLILIGSVVRPAKARLRAAGWPGAESVDQFGLAAWQAAAQASWAVGLIALLRGNNVALVAWPFALAAWAIGDSRSRPTYGRPEYDVPNDDLFRRVQELAEVERVLVPRVSVVTADRGQAEVRASRRVVLTVSLLRDFGRRFVDALVMRALCLERMRLGEGSGIGATAVSLAAVLAGSVVAAFALTFDRGGVQAARAAIRGWEPLMAAWVVGLLTLGIRAAGRHQTVIADSRAAARLDDPAVLISAIGEQERRRGAPLQRNSVEDFFLSQPAISRRAAVLARPPEISEEKLVAALDRSPSEDVDRYALPGSVASAVAGRASPVTALRKRILDLSGITGLGVLLSVASVSALAAGAVGPAAIGSTILIGGAVAAALLYQGTLHVVSRCGHRQIYQLLRDRLVADGFDAEVAGSVFVGLAPDDRVKIYGAQPAWDLGVLLPEGDRLFYVGDRTHFALNRERIKGVTLLYVRLGWKRQRRVLVRWLGDTDQESTFAVWPMPRPGAADTFRANDLARRLTIWPRHAVRGDRGAWPDLPPPDFTAATGKTYKEAANLRFITSVTIFLATTALLWAWLVGLPFDLTPFRGAGYVVALTVGVPIGTLLLERNLIRETIHHDIGDPSPP